MNLMRLVLLAAVAPMCLIQGCDNASNEALPNSGINLCINRYEMCIDPIFQNPTNTGATCSQAGCHNLPGGAPAGGFGLNPGAMMGSPEMMMNFTAVEARTLNNNLLLNKAATLGGTPHGGGQQFRVNDLCYDAIAEWRSVPAPTDGSPCNLGSFSTACLGGAGGPALIATCGP